MITSIFYIIGFFLGGYAGWHLHKSYLEHLITLKEQLERDEKENNRYRPVINDDKINVIIKRYEDIFYVYASDGTFLAQGKSSKEVGERLSERFPGKEFFGDKENVKEVDFK